jgi:hypothetical protein
MDWIVRALRATSGAPGVPARPPGCPRTGETPVAPRFAQDDTVHLCHDLTGHTLDRRQRLLEIGKDIVHVLNADRDAHHAVSDADFAAAFFADSCVRHGRGM